MAGLFYLMFRSVRFRWCILANDILNTLKNANPGFTFDIPTAQSYRYGTTKTKPSPTLFVANIPSNAWFERVEAVFISDPGVTNVRQAKRLTMIFVDYEDISSATKFVPTITLVQLRPTPKQLIRNSYFLSSSASLPRQFYDIDLSPPTLSSLA